MKRRASRPKAPPSSAVVRPSELQAAAMAAAPPVGSGAAHAHDPSAPRLFSQLPLSQPTLDGLAQAKFRRMTAIQRAAIPHALAGRDVLGAARTGQGKTLAFLVPVLERLVHDGVTPDCGLSALIISPTRELALQIFEIVRQIGRLHHGLSAGLVIGGKDYGDEASLIARMNVLIGTPGRLVHHLDNTPSFTADNLRLLVLDEADRCLDLGFRTALDAILDHLPTERQTLLFSATQTRAVGVLARLALRQPEYVAVHDDARHVTPPRLAQSYLVCGAGDKLDLLLGFALAHASAKTLVFVSSRKQVRFLFQVLGRLSPTRLPSSALYQLHSGMSQAQRLAAFAAFSEATHGLLIATDLAGRGLDFAGVAWVVQYDCPDSVETYIHRVGRTARFTASGRALLFLLEGEARPMVDRCRQRGVALARVRPNPAQVQAGTAGRLRSLLAQDPDLKYCAQAAFVSYVRSVHLAADKDVFKLDYIALDELAQSMGLSGTPKIKLKGASGQSKHALKNQSRHLLQPSPASTTAAPDKLQKLLTKKASNVHQRLRDDDDSDDDDADFVKVKDAVTDAGSDSDDDDRASSRMPSLEGVPLASQDQYADRLRANLSKADRDVDKDTERRRIQQLHRDEKRKTKRRRMDPAESGGRVELAGNADDDDEGEDDDQCPDLVASNGADDDVEARARAILQRSLST